METLEKMALADLKVYVRKLKTLSDNQKMDLHDLAEGLPEDYERLMEVATATFETFKKLAVAKHILSQREKLT